MAFLVRRGATRDSPLRPCLPQNSGIKKTSTCKSILSQKGKTKEALFYEWRICKTLMRRKQQRLPERSWAACLSSEKHLVKWSHHDAFHPLSLDYVGSLSAICGFGLKNPIPSLPRSITPQRTLRSPLAQLSVLPWNVKSQVIFLNIVVITTTVKQIRTDFKSRS